MKVALVTGSSKGIGKEIVVELAKNNYDVVINYNSSKDEAYKVQEEIAKCFTIFASRQREIRGKSSVFC